MIWLLSAAFAGVPTKLPPAPQRGEKVYRDNCWACHGRRALGDGPLALIGPTPAPALAGRVPEDRSGWRAEMEHGTATMPAYGQALEPAELRAVLIWLATLDPETGEAPSSGEEDPPEEETEAGEGEAGAG